jgi:hypothetical protein
MISLVSFGGGFTFSSFSTLAATSGDGQASASSSAGGATISFRFRRLPIMSNVRDELPSLLLTPFALLDFTGAGGFGTT